MTVWLIAHLVAVAADVTLLLRANLARTLAWTGSTGLAATSLV